MCRKCVTMFLALLMIMTMGTACQTSTNATVPSETTTEETNDSTAPSDTSASLETTVSETTAPAPTSTPVVTDRVVDAYGQLQVIGTNLCDAKGNPVQLKGMSLHGLNYVGDFITEASIKTLAEDWGCSVIRLPLYTEEDCYIKYPDKYYETLCKGIDLCIEQGIYVIVDWHILSDGDPLTYLDESKDLFTKISEKYGNSPNVIYEICNEPNSGHQNDPNKVVTWKENIKPYAEQIVSLIRENDPDNIIIIGTSTWSQDIDIAAADPVDGTNLMYTAHFYAGSHGQDLRDKIKKAIDLGIAPFVTEWGTTNDSGNGLLYLPESEQWLDFLDQNKISWCNWSIGSSIAEKTNALKMVSNILTPEQKAAAHWPDTFITPSGLFVRSKILGIPYQPES